MCDMDSGEFQAIDDIGYCFDCERKTQEWKDKVLENVKSNESAKIKSDNIKNTLEYLLRITELWEIPYQDFSGTSDYCIYQQLWHSGRKSWIDETVKKAKPYFEGWDTWDKLPDEEYHVRVMSYFLSIDNIW